LAAARKLLDKLTHMQANCSGKVTTIVHQLFSSIVSMSVVQAS